MSISRVSQGHKVAVVTNADGDSPSRVSQGHKIMVFNPGTSPVRVSQGYKVVVFRTTATPPPEPGGDRRRGFMNFIP